MQNMATATSSGNQSTCSPQFIELLGVCKSKMPFGADRVNSSTNATSGGFPGLLRRRGRAALPPRVRMTESADHVKQKRRRATLEVEPCSIKASFGICREQADNILAAGQRRLHGPQRLHSGDCKRLSPAGNPRRSSWRPGGGPGNWSLPFRIEHQYSVASSTPRFFKASSAS
jgi:hypothetical protein